MVALTLRSDPVAKDLAEGIVAIGNEVADILTQVADRVDLAINTAGSA